MAIVIRNTNEKTGKTENGKYEVRVGKEGLALYILTNSGWKLVHHEPDKDNFYSSRFTNSCFN